MKHSFCFYLMHFQFFSVWEHLAFSSCKFVCLHWKSRLQEMKQVFSKFILFVFVCLIVWSLGCLFDCLFVSLFLCLLVCLFDCFIVSLLVCLFVCLFVCLIAWLLCLFDCCVCLIVSLFLCIFNRLFVSLIVCLFVSLFVCFKKHWLRHIMIV